MREAETAVVVLAAGKGTRMKSDRPKVLHEIAGRAMVAHLLDTAASLAPTRQVVVVGPDMDAVTQAVAPVPTALQADQRGTGDAVKAARDALAGFAGDVLVLYGDTPFLSAGTLAALRDARRAADNPAVAVLGFRPADPGAYGRLVTDGDGHLEAIVEYKDADADQRAIGLCNSGAMAIDGRVLWHLLDRVGNANAKGEYYLTDIVALARADGRTCRVVEAPEDELQGVNSRAELAAAEARCQDRLRAAAMAAGATLVDPASTFLSWDTRLGRDVVVEPHVVFAPGVTVADGARIRAFSHLEGTHVAAGAMVGPYARLRPGAEIGAGCHIGNFVEIKKAVVEAGAKVNHLTYIGDARIGARANIGAGTITCNYDGVNKHHTDIGAGAFIGSNSALVAPVTIGDGALIGAGSTITRDVPADALAVARGDQKLRETWAARFRARQQKKT